MFKRISMSLFTTKNTVTGDKIPLVYREPGIIYGYRLQHQPIKFYVKSMFQIHNETVNIWTHMIAIVIIITTTYRCVQQVDDQSYAGVIICFGICSVLYALLSTAAHTLHSKSPIFHYTCFQIDYIGIGYYSLGCSFLIYYTGCHEDHYAMLEDYFLSGVVVMSWVGFICCCIAKLRYRRPYPPYMKLWNICSFGFQYTSVFTVVLARYYDCWVNNTLSTLNHHTIATSYVILSVVFYASHVPERFFPGRFDILGKGHQIFHVICSLGTVEQFNAAMIDIKHQTPLLTNHKPHPGHILISILVYTIICLITLKYLHSYTKNRIIADEEFEKLKTN